MTDDLDPTSPDAGTPAQPDAPSGPEDRSADGERATHRSGFVALVGRPNVGKSTLTNALVGEKVAITSSKPQTTRRAIRGIVTGENAQTILVDTPGVHRPRTLLGERLNDLVRETLGEVDVVGFCLPADQKIGPGDRFIAEDLVEMRTGRRGPRVIAVVTKTDLVNRDLLAQHLMAVDQLMDFDEIVPISAVKGDQIDVLLEVIAKQLPEGPQLYPDDQLTEESRDDRISELIREAALEGVREELPHSIAVVVEEVVETDPDDPFVARRTGRGQARGARDPLRGARQPEGHHHRQGRLAPEGRRYPGPRGDQPPHRPQGAPGPARQGRQGVAARSQAAGPPRVLTGHAAERTVTGDAGVRIVSGS